MQTLKAQRTKTFARIIIIIFLLVYIYIFKKTAISFLVYLVIHTEVLFSQLN